MNRAAVVVARNAANINETAADWRPVAFAAQVKILREHQYLAAVVVGAVVYVCRHGFKVVDAVNLYDVVGVVGVGVFLNLERGGTAESVRESVSQRA